MPQSDAYGNCDANGNRDSYCHCNSNPHCNSYSYDDSETNAHGKAASNSCPSAVVAGVAG